MPILVQAVTYRCGHRGIVHHVGSATEGYRLARVLGQSRCIRCDPNASPVIWFDRIGLDAMLASEQPPDPA